MSINTIYIFTDIAKIADFSIDFDMGCDFVFISYEE